MTNISFFIVLTAIKLIPRLFVIRDRHGRGCIWYLDLPITPNVESSNPTQTIQQYVTKFVSGFLQFPPPIKWTATI
jgi:hypothetical protein